MLSSVFWGLSGGSGPSTMDVAMEDIEIWPENLRANAPILSKHEKELAAMLLSLGQHHLFGAWEPPGVEDDLKHDFFEQVDTLDKSYVSSTAGGLAAYIQRARVLLTNSKSGENPFDGWRPEIPSGVHLEPFTEEYTSYESKGIPELGHCGFVLVAGGLGERLGYNGIKIGLPSETVTGITYIGLYCQQILAMQRRYGKPGLLIPLAIMVSDDTIEKTNDILSENDYFGLSPKQVTLMKQGKVPALMSNAAHMAMCSPYQIDAKPHGHGDVHSLMHSTGTAQKWCESGIKWVVFFQDTNGLALFTLPAMLGVSVDMQLEVNSLAITRFAKQAIGAITKLVHRNGKEMTINVEYNQLDPLLRATIAPEHGDTNDPVTGNSPFPGNINQLLFRLEPYLRTLQESQGVMPEFVNPKYADESKTKFKKPTRLECMMQDYPKLLSGNAKVGFTSAPSWICYSPCKNNSKDAAASIASGIPAASAYTAECDQYFVFAEMLRRLGARITPLPVQPILEIKGSIGPKIVFHPSFALFPHEVINKVPYPSKIEISPRSTLVITGDVILNDIRLDGSLAVSAVEGTRMIVKASKSSIVNEGHQLILLNDLKNFTELKNESDNNDGSIVLKSPSTSKSASKSSPHELYLPHQPQEIDVMRGYMIIKSDEFIATTKDIHYAVVSMDVGSEGATSAGVGTEEGSAGGATEENNPSQPFNPNHSSTSEVTIVEYVLSAMGLGGSNDTHDISNNNDTNKEINEESLKELSLSNDVKKATIDYVFTGSVVIEASSYEEEGVVQSQNGMTCRPSCFTGCL
eukprot:gene14423-19354_t